MSTILLKKIWIVSRNAFLITLIQCLSCVVLLAHESSAQGTDKVYLSVNWQNVELKDALATIENKTGYEFFFKDVNVAGIKNISLVAVDESLKEILIRLSREKGLRFKRLNNVISVIKLPNEENDPVIEEKDYLEREISGKVTDENDEGIPGVNVLVKGTNLGTVTDANGSYSLDVPDDAAILVFSYVGYLTEEVEIASRTSIDIVLALDIERLSEIVVVGYGTKSRENFTGSVSEVNSEVISKRLNTSGIGSLQGLLPGVVVTRESGEVGQEGVSFRIRGATSENNSPPLVIIDGVPSAHRDLDLINPADIENITVLKDGTASIYGARAASGVVLVTTKKGEGAPKVSFNTNVSVKMPGIYPERTTTLQHMEMANEAFENDGNFTSGFAKYKDQALTNDWIEGPFADTPSIWFGDIDQEDALWEEAITQSYNFNIQGSNDNSAYLFSAGYLNEDSMLKFGKNYNKRYNVRLNYDYNITDNLKLNTIISLAFKDNVEPTLFDTTIGQQNSTWSSFPIYANNGMFYNFGGFRSAAAAAELGGERTIRTNISHINFKLEYSFEGALDGLLATARVGVVTTKETDKYFTAHYFTSNGSDGQRIQENPGGGRTRIFNGLLEDSFKNFTARLNYDKTFAGIHNVNLMAGVSQEESKVERFSAWRDFALSDELHTLNLGSADDQFNTGSATEWALRSFFSRAGYSFDHRYSVEGVFRYDGSSRFVGDSRWKSFVGVSGAWIVSNESFIKSLDFFDNLKLRLSYGESGNQGGIGLYDYIQLINIDDDIEPSSRDGDNIGNYPFGVTPSNNPSAKLAGTVSRARTWEKIATQNIGLDFAIFNNRLSGSFDYFVKKNTNMLIPVVFPEVLGANAPETNNGSLETKGWEATLRWDGKIKDFSYFISAFVSDDKNELTDLAGRDNYGEGIVEFREGFPINSIFGYRHAGNIQTEQELEEYKQLPGVSQAIRVGDAKYVDLDKNGEIDPFGDQENGDTGDLDYLGNTNIRYSFALNMGAQYKGFDFSVRFQGVGRQTLILTDWALQPMRMFWIQPFAFTYNDTWAPDRTGARLPRLSGTWGSAATAWNYRASDNLLYNSGYVRLSDIQIGYSMNSKDQPWLNSISISQLRVYVNGRDLWETSSLPKGFNPETGLRASFHPYPRYIGMGLDITF